MDVQVLTRFLLWCTVINVGLMTLWFVTYALAPGLVYRTQSKIVPMSRETFDLVFYGFLGLFKIAVLIFNVVPYAALSILG